MARAKRQRRTAEEAREAILDAAAEVLSEVGPDGIRLQEIAARVGVSHPAILHHFGSRDGLVEAVARRAIVNLEAELVRVLADPPEANESPSLDAVRRAYRVLVDEGHARVIAWLLLSGHEVARDARVRVVSEVAHERRKKIEGPGGGDFEDTLFRTLLVGFALFGDAIAGPSLRKSAGLGDDPGAAERFRVWLSKIVTPTAAK